MEFGESVLLRPAVEKNAMRVGDQMVNVDITSALVQRSFVTLDTSLLLFLNGSALVAVCFRGRSDIQSTR